MKDGLIKGEGNSRLIKATWPDTYEEFQTAAFYGELPLDLLYNANGWQQEPTFLNKNSLLRDTTANRLSLTGEPLVDDAINALYDKIENNDSVLQAQINKGKWVKLGGLSLNSVPVSYEYPFEIDLSLPISKLNRMIIWFYGVGGGSVSLLAYKGAETTGNSGSYVTIGHGLVSGVKSNCYMDITLPPFDALKQTQVAVLVAPLVNSATGATVEYALCNLEILNKLYFVVSRGIVGATYTADIEVYGIESLL